MSAETVPVIIQQSMVVTRSDVDDLKRQRELLREFVGSQLKEAQFTDKDSPDYGEGDYGIIPGTKKRCLFKPGAEKMQKLFRLGCRFREVSQVFDRKGNFAMFVYRAEVYDIKSGSVIADCEAACNSQEAKYRERSDWKPAKKKGAPRELVKVETPICDIINTLMKMAQKRAMVGATILATGASEYFTQDMLEPEDLAAMNPNSSSGKKSAPVEPDEVPVCCENEMMISKYHDKDLDCVPFYCPKCRSKKPR